MRDATRIAGEVEAEGAGVPGRLHELSSSASASPTAQLARRSFFRY